MSMTPPTTTPVKQRKLNDLRVVDLQRELRSFNIPYDKKELKLSLIEKLRHALLNRNIDPDNYFFDAAIDLKPISSDEAHRTHEDIISHETSTSEVDLKQQSATENSVLTASSTKTSTTALSSPRIHEIEAEQTDQINPMDTNNLEEIAQDYESNNTFPTVDQLTTKHEDENNNDKTDHDLTQVSCSSSDEEFDTNNRIEDSTNKHVLDHNTESEAAAATTTTATLNTNTVITSSTEQQSSLDHMHSEDGQQTNLSTDDNSNLSKSEVINRQESTDAQQKKENATKSNKDDCFLWVSNIAKETHASDLKALFSKHAKVLTTKVIGSSSSQWFGYIHLATPDDVEKCIQALHQTELHGKKIYVDREMHDQTSEPKSNHSSTSSYPRTSSSSQKKRSDQSSHKQSTNDSYKNRDSIKDHQVKSSSLDTNPSSKKRSASTSIENKQKKSTSDINKSNHDERNVRPHDIDLLTRKPSESYNENRRNSSSSSSSQPTKHRTSNTDVSKTSDKLETSQKSTTADRKTNKNSLRSDKLPTNSAYTAKSSISNRSHSNEKRYTPSSAKSDNLRSSSIDKSKQQISSHMTSNRYDKPKDVFSKDVTHHSGPSKTFDNDRRAAYQNEERLRHEKEMLVRKQYVQQQEEENIKEQQRHLAEERARMRREFEILERERMEIERTRLVLEKEKQDQARELEKQQRRLADEAKHRQQEAEAKLRDEKLQRLSQGDSKRQRSSHHEVLRSHQSSTSNSSNSSKGYDHRSSATTTGGRGRDRSIDDRNHDYYTEPKRPYGFNQREGTFRDRVIYRESDLAQATSAGLGLSSSTSINSNNNQQRYGPSSSNQHRLSDSYNALPQRGRDMALPPTSSVSAAYERSSRNISPPPSNNNAILRRPHSRERFDERDYIQSASRRDRSPIASNTLRREPMETAHWERPKPRDAIHYPDDTHKYLPNQYLSESSQSTQQQQQQQQQQGLWSAAPPSRQQHHHPELPVKSGSHAPVTDPYGWPHVSQQGPPPSLSGHHPQALSSSHDRSRANMNSTQRIPILSSNQPPPPPPPPPSSSRGSTTGQTHLYSHPGVPVNALPTSQQHASLPPPPSSLHHTTAYVTQQAPPSGLVLHPTGQTRSYEQHYVVTQPLSQRRY